MSYERVTALAEKLRQELKVIESELGDLNVQAAAIRRALATLESAQAATPKTTERATRRGGRGTQGIREAVIAALVDAPDHTLSDRAILEHLRAVGTAPASEDALTALRATLSRMVGVATLDRLSPGVYRLPDADESTDLHEVASAANGSGDVTSHQIREGW